MGVPEFVLGVGDDGVGVMAVEVAHGRCAAVHLLVFLGADQHVGRAVWVSTWGKISVEPKGGCRPGSSSRTNSVSQPAACTKSTNGLKRRSAPGIGGTMVSRGIIRKAVSGER